MVLLVSYAVCATHGIEVFRAFHALAHRSIVRDEAHAPEIAAIINTRVQSAFESNKVQLILDVIIFFVYLRGKYRIFPHEAR